MLPDEMQSLFAKILLFIFSITLLCMGKARAEDQVLNASQTQEKVIQVSSISQ